MRQPGLLLVDDDRLVAQGVAALLRGTQRFAWVETAFSRAEGETMSVRLQPDVILMDVRLETETEGIDATREILKANPRARVIMLSAFGQPLWKTRSRRAGAVGYLLKDATLEELLAEIDRVLRAKPPPPGCIIDELTLREVQVLRLVAQGLTNAQIARKLPKRNDPSAGPITERVVKGILTDGVYPKLEVDNRVDAVRRGIERGYLAPLPSGANGHER